MKFKKRYLLALSLIVVITILCFVLMYPRANGYDEPTVVEENAPQNPVESPGETHSEPPVVEETAPQNSVESPGESHSEPPDMEVATENPVESPGESDDRPYQEHQSSSSFLILQQTGANNIPEGFFVVPEFPLGTVTGLILALASLAVFHKGCRR